jgi:predicted nuclease with TOPRIM domain
MRIITALLLSVCLLSACERSGRTTRAGYEDPALERDRYEHRISARLNEFEHRFDGLEARLKGLDEASKERLRLDVAELRDRKDMLENKFDDLKDVSIDSWHELRSSLDRSVDELEMAYNIVAANNNGVLPVVPAPNRR